MSNRYKEEIDETYFFSQSEGCPSHGVSFVVKADNDDNDDADFDHENGDLVDDHYNHGDDDNSGFSVCCFFIFVLLLLYEISFLLHASFVLLELSKCPFLFLFLPLSVSASVGLSAYNTILTASHDLIHYMCFETGPGTTCCEKIPFNTNSAVCCDGEVHRKMGPRTSCCGKKAYDAQTQVCCNKDIVLKANAGYNLACSPGNDAGQGHSYGGLPVSPRQRFNQAPLLLYSFTKALLLPLFGVSKYTRTSSNVTVQSRA